MSAVPLIFTIAVTQRIILKYSITISYEHTCYSVTVLQFQNNYYQKVKNKLYIYIYKYIYKYRSIFRYGGKHFENCNTATLQQRVQSRSLLQLCRAPKASTKSTLQTANSAIKKFFEKKSKTFVNRNENVVTLQTEIKKDPLNLPA